MTVDFAEALENVHPTIDSVALEKSGEGMAEAMEKVQPLVNAEDTAMFQFQAITDKDRDDYVKTSFANDATATAIATTAATVAGTALGGKFGALVASKGVPSAVAGFKYWQSRNKDGAEFWDDYFEETLEYQHSSGFSKGLAHSYSMGLIDPAETQAGGAGYMLGSLTGAIFRDAHLAAGLTNFLPFTKGKTVFSGTGTIPDIARDAVGLSLAIAVGDGMTVYNEEVGRGSPQGKAVEYAMARGIASGATSLLLAPFAGLAQGKIYSWIYNKTSAPRQVQRALNATQAANVITGWMGMSQLTENGIHKAYGNDDKVVDVSAKDLAILYGATTAGTYGLSWLGTAMTAGFGKGAGYTKKKLGEYVQKKGEKKALKIGEEVTEEVLSKASTENVAEDVAEDFKRREFDDLESFGEMFDKSVDELNAESMADEIVKDAQAWHIGSEDYNYALPPHIEKRVVKMNPEQISETVSDIMEKSATNGLSPEDTARSALREMSKYHAVDRDSIVKIMEGIYGTR